MWEGGTTSTTPFHLDQFSRILFRLTNAPATFQRLMERCLAGLNLKIYLVCCHYIIVFSNTLNETLKRSEIVLKRLCDFGLKLKTVKCKHFYTKLLTFPYHVSHKKTVNHCCHRQGPRQRFQSPVHLGTDQQDKEDPEDIMEELESL